MKTYYARFGSGDPRTHTGLSPTFLIFSQNGTAVTPPSIAEVTGATGIYSFQWGTTTPIAFLIDGATTGLLTSDRYITGSIDPADRIDEVGATLAAIGTSNNALGVTSVALGITNVSYWAGAGSTLFSLGTTSVALGNTAVALGLSGGVVPLIGTTGSTFGSSASDPVDLFGYLKRIQENLEGNNNFTKATGVLDIYSRGSSTLLISKTVANSASMVTKT